MNRLPMLALAYTLAACLAASEGYAPTVDAVRFYHWKTTQEARWRSAGDDLRYTTTIDWDLGLRCTAVDDARMRLSLTFITVAARHHGPGVDIAIDSRDGSGIDDPLLGHLHALAGATLLLDVERTTGRVVTVQGGEAVIAAINQRAPAPVVGDPPPLEAAAHAAYGPEALSRLWSQILALPGAGTEAPLPAPFTGGGIARTWNGQEWSVRAQPDAAPTFALAQDPSPVNGSVRDLAGTGSVTLHDGLPQRAHGSLSFVLAISAMTQPVESTHAVTWDLTAQ